MHRTSQFAAFVRKEIYHIFRDRRTVMIMLVMPIVQIILFGFAISNEVRNVRLVVLDPSRDATTTQIVESFRANSYFTLMGSINTPDQIEPLFRRGEVDLALVFGPNFHDDLTREHRAQVQLIADGADPNMASMITYYASNIIQGALMPSAQQPSVTPSPMIIVPEIKLLYNPQMKSAYNFVPGIMGFILTLICAMMTAVSIVREKERGTMEVLLVSPMRPIFMIVAKMAPYMLVSAANLVTIILLSVYLLGVPVTGHLWLMGVTSLLFISASLALGLLISTLVRTQVVAMILSGMALMMPVAMLSGMMFPVESMPLILQWLSAIIPARWYIASIRKVMIEGLGIEYVLTEIAITTGMVAALIGISLSKFKNRLA
ncbi:MAG: ABC transporter permease [Rikenellaceae bacterium]|jgi:ABC-2 type transport system permease protein|nr:ABC transporter permease [Rikenellaceae bacterium]